ncbi:hypothetical protein L7F22_024257 [Adiantum nelumboides]|nr:hypothetical protein [Adiantum nelumboides]
MYGCWSGSATLVNDGKPVLAYTGWSNLSHSPDHKVQMQALALPADHDDPLLRKWVKASQNPILTASEGIDSNFFRDPTTAWIGEDGKWRMLIGSQENLSGVALLYTSSDFFTWKKASAPLHGVDSTGMWECPDFFPVHLLGKHGLDTSSNGKDVMHVLKVSCVHDYYVVGTYIASNDTFTPAQANLDAGIGFRYDYGKYYASKSFYDGKKKRRIIFGWVNESDDEKADIAKGWASVQSFPRMVWLDSDTNYSLLQWPVEEVESLHKTKVSLESLPLGTGTIMQVKGIKGAQLEIDVEFELLERNQAEMIDVSALNVEQICSEKGASRSGVLGPFGLLVLASDDLVEQTAIFFVIVESRDGWKVVVCSDQSRSSLETNLDKTSYGSFDSLIGGQTSVSLHLLVDHSIVETFALGGRVCITCRVYPTKAIDRAAHLFVFNNGTVPIFLKTLDAWELADVTMDAI